MDNVVQNISINDIIPTNFEPTTEEKLKIEELAILIKQFGLLDPILVRQKNNKYEIIMGIDKYQAALIANQTSLPAIIKELDEIIDRPHKTYGICFSPAGNGKYSKNLNTGLTLQDDFVTHIYQPLLNRNKVMLKKSGS